MNQSQPSQAPSHYDDLERRDPQQREADLMAALSRQVAHAKATSTAQLEGNLSSEGTVGTQGSQFLTNPRVSGVGVASGATLDLQGVAVGAEAGKEKVKFFRNPAGPSYLLTAPFGRDA